MEASMYPIAFGGAGPDAIQGMAIDFEGNFYATGAFNGTVDFDIGPGVTTLTSAGSQDGYVVKYDANGDFVWASRLGGTSEDHPAAITIGGDGGVYTTGTFNGTADFDPGAGTFSLASAGSQDIYVSKLDADGDFAWAARLGGPQIDQAAAIIVDSTGTVQTTGYFSGAADFDPGAGVVTLNSAGGRDVYLSSLDSDGNFVAATLFGGTGLDQATDIDVDAAGNIYTNSRFSGTIDADPGVGVTNLTSSGGLDPVISKTNTSGDLLWARGIGGSQNDHSAKIAVDDLGNVYATGNFSGTADFDPGEGTFNLTSLGGESGFITKLDANGNFLWARQLAGSSDGSSNGVAIDGSGNVYVGAYFTGTIDADPGSGTFTLNSAGGQDGVVAKLDSNGDFLDAYQIGGAGNDRVSLVKIDQANNVYVSGVFNGTVDLDVGSGVDMRTSAGANDVFVIKLAEPEPEPELSLSDASVVEGTGEQSTLTFTVTLSVAATTAITVDYETVAGTAIAGSDFGGVA
jgi:hypothetical protein